MYGVEGLYGTKVPKDVCIPAGAIGHITVSSAQACLLSVVHRGREQELWVAREDLAWLPDAHTDALTAGDAVAPAGPSATLVAATTADKAAKLSSSAVVARYDLRSCGDGERKGAEAEVVAGTPGVLAVIAVEMAGGKHQPESKHGGSDSKARDAAVGAGRKELRIGVGARPREGLRGPNMVTVVLAHRRLTAVITGMCGWVGFVNSIKVTVGSMLPLVNVPVHVHVRVPMHWFCNCVCGTFCLAATDMA